MTQMTLPSAGPPVLLATYSAALRSQQQKSHLAPVSGQGEQRVERNALIFLIFLSHRPVTQRHAASCRTSRSRYRPRTPGPRGTRGDCSSKGGPGCQVQSVDVVSRCNGRSSPSRSSCWWPRCSRRSTSQRRTLPRTQRQARLRLRTRRRRHPIRRRPRLLIPRPMPRRIRRLHRPRIRRLPRPLIRPSRRPPTLRLPRRRTRPSSPRRRRPRIPLPTRRSSPRPMRRLRRRRSRRRIRPPIRCPIRPPLHRHVRRGHVGVRAGRFDRGSRSPDR